MKTMNASLIRSAVALYLAGSLAMGLPAFAQSQAQQQSQAQTQQSQTQSQPAQNAAAPQTAAPRSFPNLFQGPDYSHGKRMFPNLFSVYSPMRIPPPDLTNSPTLASMIHDGKLQLAIEDAIGLALANDLDIQVQRFQPWFGETDLLRTEGGGTPQGQFTFGSGGGGAFDPVLFSSLNISDAVTPVANPFTSGVGSSGVGSAQSHSDQYSFGYSQLLHTGTSFTAQFQNIRASSNATANFFNPSLQNSLSINLSQPLLRGFGILPTTRFIIEAKNEVKQNKLTFEQQVITTVTAVQNQYWAYVGARENVAVQQSALATAQKLYSDNQRQLQIGTMAPLDVLTAQSEVAADNQQLIFAQTNELQQQTVLMNLISKNSMDTTLQGVEIIPTTTADNIPPVPTIAVPDAVKEAWSKRPELQFDELGLNTAGIEVKATRNELLPSLTLSGTYQSTSLAGVLTTSASTPTGAFTTGATIVDSTGTPVAPSQFVGIPVVTTTTTRTATGLGDNYDTIFHNKFPTYAASLSFSLPLRNRSAQADNARAQLTQRQLQTMYQRDQNTIAVAVHNALIAIQQGQSQVAAATTATQLAQQTLDDEQKRYQLGASTSYQVILRSRDLTTAKFNELQARINLEIALVNFNQAMGRSLDANNITLSAGNQNPRIFSDPLIPGTIDGELAGSTPALHQ
ncbi:MAG TPA: TolC family protein [Candidatus Acidoferrales bacterium]|nr:TolC family protein [Candidatus Acidoferrales bacterium]